MTQPNNEKSKALANSTDYGRIAQEYYDQNAHPTCYDFNRLSRVALTHLLRDLAPKGHFLEVGAGCSSLAPFLAKKGIPLAQLTVSDISPDMLGYSRNWIQQGASGVACKAEALPFAANSINALVASLGDPYNSYKFWKETARVLTPGGAVYFTSPSFEWAYDFRNTEDGSRVDEARFTLADGSAVSVPSIILPASMQQQLINSAGLVVHARSELSDQFITGIASPKLQLATSKGAPILIAYLAKKPN